MSDTWVEKGPTAPLSTEKSRESLTPFTERYETLIETTKETKEDSQLRERVLAWVDDIVKKWVVAEATNKGFRPEDAKSIGGRIFSFGSYRLGVHGPGADIDTLVLTPRHVSREEFFNTLQDELKASPRVTELVGVPDAATPLIKLKVDGISLDLLFASLDVNSIPNDFEVLADSVLKGVDQQTQRSLNGTRVATQMLKCVPNVHVFRSVLRGIKKWAQNRGVYGNVYGYPGGVAWAILVARVCQLYPNMSSGEVFLKFFAFHKNWWKPDPDMNKSPNNPVYLQSTLDIGENKYGFKIWNRRVHQEDRRDTFPIITPCYPAMNACYNVSIPTLRVMCGEFERAVMLINESGPDHENLSFTELMQPVDFFKKYTTYLKIIAGSSDLENGRRWAGFVESRLRRLLIQLNLIQGLRVHLLPKEFCLDIPSESHPEEAVSHVWFIGLDTSLLTKRDIPLDTAWNVYLSHITGPTVKFERSPGMFEPRLVIIKRKDLPTEAGFALSPEDITDISRLLVQHKKERKKRKRLSEQQEAAKPPDSPAFRPTCDVPEIDAPKASATPSPKKRASTPRKKSLTDQLIADAYGF
eukprot:TRINITY_DN4427_c0_g1_i1.p1 TRINITY_DN4427_c0_g1~~TRINITY_DN4427_c0_g1_i1.p1  ORF type:complete len:583 (+),score=65.12 TRINITY_DN4427_c0_g1_i1:76-1824(+)